MSSINRRGFITGSLASLAVLAGCSTGESVDVTGGTPEPGAGGDPTTPAAAGRVLVAAISGEPDKLDPHSTTSYNSFQVLENVFDTLVEPDENLVMQPALAESWETSEDQLTWTFTVRSGITWHDGTEFSAEDVAYSFNRIIDESMSPSWRFSNVESIEAPDATTLVITVKSPSPNLLANIGGYKGLSIVQQANVESGDINTSPIGTGPFKLESFTQGDDIKLVANPDYWDGAPKLGGVTFRFISEGSTALAALRGDEIQWTDSIPPQQVSALENDADLELGQVGSNDYWYLALNQANEPWSDVRVRQAVAYAIDRDALVQAAQYGNATQNQLAIPESSDYYTEYAPYSFDLDKAKSLMAEAGVYGGTMTFLATTDYPETVTVGQLLVDQLSEIGIDVTINTVDFSTWLDEQGNGNFDCLMMGWLGNLDPDDFYYSQHHSDGGNNYQSYSNPDVDQLLEQGRVELDQDKRKEIYGDLAKIIADECSYIYLYNPDVVQAYSPELSGYIVRGNRAIRFRAAELG